MKQPPPPADSRRAGRKAGAGAANRPKLRIKATKRGRPIGLPPERDGIFDLPGTKRASRSSAAEAERRIARIVLASRLPGENSNAKARAYMRAIGLPGAEQSADALAAVERWLRKPERCDPPRLNRPTLPFGEILRESHSR